MYECMYVLTKAISNQFNIKCKSDHRIPQCHEKYNQSKNRICSHHFTLQITMHFVALRSWYKTEFRRFYKKDFEQKKKIITVTTYRNPLTINPLRDNRHET